VGAVVRPAALTPDHLDGNPAPPPGRFTLTTPDPAPEARRAWVLPLLAAVVLTAFYYLARADTIGVSSPQRGWTPMTSAPLSSWQHFLAAALLLGLIPVVSARALGVRHLGLGLGDWRLGLRLLAVGLPLAVAAGWIGATAAATRAVYPLDPTAAGTHFTGYAGLQFLYFGAWEVLFRGVLLFGLRSRLGDRGAVALQTALSVTAHFGRSLTETTAAIPAGLLFGFVDLRVGSIWYVALVHWIVGVSQDFFLLP
jgi:membrane protease YdiL (CAAX protease family)